jgi:Domain of unknown function (DUF4394)
MTRQTRHIAVSVAALAASLISTSVLADTVAGLSGGKTLVWIDTAAKKVTKSVEISGAVLVGMDVRPTDKQLYGVTADGKIMIVDPATGKTTMKSQISEALPANASITVDFNPVADRMRLMGSDGTSLRINVDDGKATVDGKHKYAETDAAKGKTSTVTAGAYSNSFAGTKETALYNIDKTAGTLVKQAPPNDGILNTIGALGVKLDGDIGFDIASDGKGGNQGWLVAGTTLYTVDLMTGAAKAVGPIAGLTGGLKDIAVMP